MSAIDVRWRLPTESARPMVVFAQTRLGISLVTLLLATALGFPFGGRVAWVIAGAAVPWSMLNLFLALRRPGNALNPLVALGDLAVLVVIESLVP